MVEPFHYPIIVPESGQPAGGSIIREVIRDGVRTHDLDRPTAGAPTGWATGPPSLLLPAIGLVFGLQSMRVFLPSLVWHLGDVRGASPSALAACAFGAFLCAFLAAPLRRIVGPGLAMWLAGGGLAVSRLIEQLVPLPASDLWLSLAATAFFALFLPLAVGQMRGRGGGEAGGVRLAAGVLVGLALDSALKGAAGTLDLSWRSGPLPYFTVVALCAAFLWSLVLEPVAEADTPSETSAREAVFAVALGPFLFLQSMVLQNQGWIAQTLGWGMPQAFLVVMLGNVAAAWGLRCGLRAAHGGRRWGEAAGLLILVGAMAVAHRGGLAVGVLLLAAQAAAGWAMAATASALMVPRQRGLGWTTLWLAAGLVLHLGLIFLYYGSFYVQLPLPRLLVLPSAAAAVAGLAWFAERAERGGPMVEGAGWPVAVAMVLLLVPLLTWGVQGNEPRARPPDSGTSVRVMTYNIHSGYDSQGGQGLEAIARVIEESGAEIVALQEVSRGWLIDGSTDVPAWLSRRLGMPFVFRGTADPVWGNAILSRYPIVDRGWGGLPLDGTVLQRGYLWTRVDTGSGEPVLVVNTHLHHVEDEHVPRLAQVETLLTFWDHRPRTVLLGDLNSRPEFAEMAQLRSAGLVDAWAEAGHGDGWTWPARDPYERIDWVWHTRDLKAVSAEVLSSTASDHLAVVVTLEISR